MSTLVARDLMTTAVETTRRQTPLVEFDRTLLALGISGMPVTDDAGTIVGVVSRADIVRALSGAEAEAEAVLAYYRDVAGAQATRGDVSRMAGERAASQCVQDVMSREVIAVRPDQPVHEVARLLAERRVHRVLVTEGGRLVGLVTSLDIVRAVADRRLVGRA